MLQMRDADSMYCFALHSLQAQFTTSASMKVWKAIVDSSTRNCYFHFAEKAFNQASLLSREYLFHLLTFAQMHMTRRKDLHPGHFWYTTFSLGYWWWDANATLLSCKAPHPVDWILSNIFLTDCLRSVKHKWYSFLGSKIIPSWLICTSTS